MASPSVFTLEQRAAHCVAQNASMKTLQQWKARGASEA
jgi:hypothetical protein